MNSDFYLHKLFNLQDNERRFISTIDSEKQVSIARENKDVHAKVYQLVPVDDLEHAAKEKFKELFEEDSKTSTKFIRDLAVYELCQWFKKDFFTWVDKLKCDKCKIDMTLINVGQPTPQESADGAGRVEIYKCPACGVNGRFPRYGQVPGKLLESRKGRCGEWANCFALILRAFGFLTRHVNDFADHVWCEFYSEVSRFLLIDRAHTDYY